MKCFAKYYTPLLAVLTTLTMAPQTFAQGSGPNALEEIVVTAQRREQSLQDVAISVSAVSGDLLTLRNENEVVELTKLFPNLGFNDSSSDSGRTISIRGVGRLTNNSGLEQSVGTVVDGVAQGVVASSLLDLSDLARVELLRGPQGMLFGKNASAGVLNITTNNPTSEFEGNIGLSYADENEIKINGVVSGPIAGEKVLGRIAAYSSQRDTFIENIYPGGEDHHDRDQWGVRAKIQFLPTDNLDILLSYNHVKSDNVCCTSPIAGMTPGWQARFPNTPIGSDVDKIQDNQESYNKTDFKQFAAEINYHLGDYTLTSVTSYGETDTSSEYVTFGYPISLVPNNESIFEIDQFTQEVRLTLPAGENIEYVAGLYFYKLEQDFSSLTVIDLQAAGFVPFPFFSSATSEGSFESQSYAPFGQLTYKISDDFRLSFGGRYDVYEVDVDMFIGARPGTLPSAGVGARVADVKDENFSWRVIGEYNPADDILLFASVSEGYKGPGVNTDTSGLGRDPILEPEIPTSVELGIKSEWLDNRLRVNATLFYSEFEDFQAEVLDSTTIPPGFVLTNAGDLETQGAEIEVVAQITPQFLLSGFIAYNDATFSDYPGAACYDGQTEADGCVTDAFRNRSQDLTGKKLRQAPEWSYAIGMEYHSSLGNLPFDGFVRGDYYWRDEAQGMVVNDPGTVIDSYGIADLTFGIQDEAGRYSVQLFVKNVFDKYYEVQVQRAVVFGYERVHNIAYTYTRRVGISVRLNF